MPSEAMITKREVVWWDLIHKIYNFTMFLLQLDLLIKIRKQLQNFCCWETKLYCTRTCVDNVIMWVRRIARVFCCSNVVFSELHSGFKKIRWGIHILFSCYSTSHHWSTNFTQNFFFFFKMVQQPHFEYYGSLTFKYMNIGSPHYLEYLVVT
jgi:hypothetical protein